MQVSAIVPAAGSGRRMGAEKQYLEIAGVPVIERTISALSSCPIVAEIIIVAPQKDVEKLREKYVGSGLFNKVRDVVAGGKTRGGSVRNGVSAAKKDIVLIHDAARPFVSAGLVERTFHAAKKHGAATAALTVHDTVKLKEGGLLGGLADRDSLLLIQTPQVFFKKDLMTAYQNAPHENWTDETSLVQEAGIKVAWVEGENTNIKITVREDLKLAEMIAKGV